MRLICSVRAKSMNTTRGPIGANRKSGDAIESEWALSAGAVGGDVKGVDQEEICGR